MNASFKMTIQYGMTQQPITIDIGSLKEPLTISINAHEQQSTLNQLQQSFATLNQPPAVFGVPAIPKNNGTNLGIQLNSTEEGRYDTITANKQYENFSLEELRMKDYQLNKKHVNGGFNQPQIRRISGGFGSNSLMNTQNTPNAFGQQQSSFGRPATTFGSNTTFGQPSTNAFGKQQQSGFGSTAPSTFGQPQSSGFGSTFNRPASTFGQSQQQTGFGSFTFGQPTTTGSGQSNTSVFLSKPTSSFTNQPATSIDCTRSTGFNSQHTTSFGNTAEGYYQTITADKQYENFSLEELRLKDYQLNKKQFSNTSFGGFGSKPTTSFNNQPSFDYKQYTRFESTPATFNYTQFNGNAVQPTSTINTQTVNYPPAKDNQVINQPFLPQLPFTAQLHNLSKNASQHIKEQDNEHSHSTNHQQSINNGSQPSNVNLPDTKSAQNTITTTKCSQKTINTITLPENMTIHPPLNEIAEQMANIPNYKVKQLQVKVAQIGSITFLNPVDLLNPVNEEFMDEYSGMKISELLSKIFNELIVISKEEMAVYPIEKYTAPYGQGLNVGILVEMKNLWPIDREGNKEIRNVQDIRYTRYKEKLKQLKSQKFISYDNGVWVYKMTSGV